MPRFTPNPIQPHVLRDYRAMLRQGNQPLSALTILSGQFVARSWRSPGRSTRVLSLDREASINRLLPLYMHTASSGSCRISSGHVTCGNCACTDSVSAISDAAVPKRTLPLHPRPARVTCTKDGPRGQPRQGRGISFEAACAVSGQTSRDTPSLVRLHPLDDTLRLPYFGRITDWAEKVGELRERAECCDQVPQHEQHGSGRQRHVQHRTQQDASAPPVRCSAKHARIHGLC